MKDATSKLAEAKPLSMEETMQLIAKWRLAVFPVNVYSSRAKWNSTFNKPDDVWFVAIPCDGSVYLPLNDYEAEMGEYISTFDQNLRTPQLGETLPEAVLLAAAAAENYERLWEKEQLQRELERASKHSA